MPATTEIKTVKLTNRTRRMQVINLPASIVPECSSRALIGTVDHDGVSGERKVRAHRKVLSGSVTLCASGHEGDSAARLPLSVLAVPEIQAGLKKGDLEAALLSEEELATAESKAADEAQKAADEAAALAKTRAATEAAKLAMSLGLPPPAEQKPEAPAPAPGPEASGKKGAKSAKE